MAKETEFKVLLKNTWATKNKIGIAQRRKCKSTILLPFLETKRVN
jgi:hypothetical protein